jgi:ABC-type phosphate transport system substrate-binding protein
MSKKGLAAVAVSALTFGLLAAANVSAAHADVAAGSSDIVGVGSDTLQYMLDFGADGDFNGNNGYNVNKQSRVVSFDATPDANARAGYLNGSTSASLKALNPTVILRAGHSPIQRPNGSGAGFSAFATDTTNQINFVRSSSPESAAQVAVATGPGGVGATHEIQLATEDLAIATAQTTNAPALSKPQLMDIYQCLSTARTWNQVGGTSSDAIIPIIPQLGSGTRKTFLQDVGFTVDSAGNPTPALGSCVKTDEENNPYSLYVDSTGTPIADPFASAAVPNADAIAPFSGGRLNLYAAGYFTNPNVAYGATPPAGDEGVLHPLIKLANTGTPSSGGAVYDDNRGLYVIFRQADIASTTHFNGAAKNWVNTLFFASTGTPFFKGPAGQALLASAGVTPAYKDCGINSTSASTCV